MWTLARTGNRKWLKEHVLAHLAVIMGFLIGPHAGKNGGRAAFDQVGGLASEVPGLEPLS